VRPFVPQRWVFASATVLTACFPDFQFGPGDDPMTGGAPTSSRAASGTGPQMSLGGGGSENAGVGGAGGQGGAPSHGGDGPTGSTVSGSSSTGVVAMPTVPCGNGSSVIVECAPAQACCFSQTSAAYDECGAPGACDDYVFTCNEPSDCASGVCCADEDFFGFTGTISCVTSCSGGVLCAEDADCNPAETCEQYFANSFAPEYAPAYRICKP